jgi:myosin heavy subunit
MSEAMIQAYKGMLKTETKEIYKPNPKSLDGVPDLCMLTYLGEDNVLYNLGFRYKKGDCYTSTTAKVLVAVNPYERKDALYTEEIMARYQAAQINLEGLATAGDLPPHVFTVSNAAFNNLVAWKKNQSIIVCGESGSGKTESAKYMMRFLAFTTTSTSLDPKEFQEAEAVGKQVLDANPILESFGNAKTLLNNNSSRFGKFTKMLFEEVKVAAGSKPRRKLIGAMIESYLLEKSRVVRQDKGERNFHIFYQLTAEHSKYGHLKMDTAENFHYVGQSGCTTLDDLRFPGKAADTEWHRELLHAFNTLLIKEEQVKQIFAVVAGILHLGNVKFTQKGGEGSDIATPEAAANSAQMFEVDLKEFQVRLQTRNMVLPGGQSLVKPLNEPDAIFNRDSMARNLYNGLFRWVVWRINQQSMASEGSGVTWIGILDVFGFEIFENNSFEQFCINFANERLQQYFNEHVLKAEQDLYKKEALLWDPIDLPDNQDCIDLVMSKPYGIFPILDSTCVQPKGTDEVFTANLFKAHKYHPRLRQMKQRKRSDSDKQYETMNGFVIRHYAGAVIYDCADFLVKNADASEFDTLELFLTSKNEIATKILRIKADGQLEDTKRGFARAFRSTGSVFSDQLSELMTTLRKTAPYFVRCIKPNPTKAPKNFVDEYVRPQLRCGGLIEALRIIKLGFPTRCLYARINEIFNPILKDKPVTNLNLRDFSEGIMRYCGNDKDKLARDEYQLGLTMVFFRPGKQTYLTDILEKKPTDISKQQVTDIRKWLIKKRVFRARGTIRAWIRSRNMLNEMRFKKAAISMVLIYRTVGRVLKNARWALGNAKEAEEMSRRSKDLEFQKALAAARELKILQEQKEKMDKELAQKQETYKKTLEAKEGEIEAQEKKLAELLSQIKGLRDQVAESEQKRLQLHNTSKTQVMELQNKLMEEKNENALLKREQAGLQQSIQDYEDRIQKNKIAIEDLRKSLGLGKAEYETQIADKDRLIAELRERIRRLEEQLAELKEQSERTIRDLQEQLEHLRNESREDKNRLEVQVREKDAQVARLSSELGVLKETTDQNSRTASDNLDAVKEDLRLTRDKLERNLDNKEAELNDAKRELALLQGKLEAALAAADEAKKKAEATSNESVEKLAEFKDRADKAQRKIEAKLAETQSALNIANDRLENVKKDQDAYKATAEGQLADLQKQLRDREAENAELKEELRRTKEKFEQLQSQFTDKTVALQAEVDRAKAEARDIQARVDKELWDKNSDLDRLKSDLAVTKDRLTTDKERAESALSSTQSALESERKQNASRQMQLNAEIQAKTNDYRDLKAEFRAEKNEWRIKQEKYEKQIAAVEQDYDNLQDEINQKSNQQASLDKEAKNANDEAEALFAKKVSKYTTQIEELRQEIKDLEDVLSRARAEKNKAVSDLEIERDSWRETEQRYKDDLVRANAEIDKVEKQFISFRQQQGDEMEQKIHALQGQVSLLQSLSDDLKGDKQEAKDRENDLSNQLKEAVATAAEARSELKHLQQSVGSERDKLRAELDGLREKHAQEGAQWKEKSALQERKILEKTTLVNELKAELTEASDRENQALQNLRDGESETKDELRKLRARVDELSAEQKNWLGKQKEYEQKIGKTTKDYIELQAQYGELEHKRKTADGSRTEIEVLKTKLSASEKIISEKNKALEKQVQILRDESKHEIEDLKKEHEKALKTSEHEAKTQNEAYKYKLQYLELSQKELEKERRRWQDKEREYERALVGLTAELRELKLEHQQAVDTHEAFRAHVDAKESARTLEASSFEIKRQALVAEHQLALRQGQAAQNSKIAQLERELSRIRGDLDDAREENERLTLALETGSGLPDDVKQARKQDTAYLYEDEPKQTRQERKAERAELSASLSAEPEPEPEPTTGGSGSSGIDIDLNVSGVQVSASVDETAF